MERRSKERELKYLKRIRDNMSNSKNKEKAKIK